MDPISPSTEEARLRKQAASSNERAAPSVFLPDGTCAEMIYDREHGRTAFCVFKDGTFRYEPALSVGGERVLPYSPKNNLLRHGIVLLPSEAAEYATEAELIGRIRDYLHRHVDLSPPYETIATYYVLFSWVYDSFNELPYLRVRGDPGSGKSRFLLTVGSICYKPVFASGASTISPLFRILDAFRGTLVLDESDFRLSDEKAEVVKILNNGNAQGFPVLRTEVVNRREYDPRAYAVFGPKLIATRSFFEDRALESRCLTEEMGNGGLRTDIPINLPASAKEEALQLRNQLLLFRFRMRGALQANPVLVDSAIEPRLNQVLVPLLSVVSDAGARADIKEFARGLDSQTIADRGMDMEAQVLEVIRDLLAEKDARLAIAEIARRFTDRFGGDYGAITPKRMGAVVRKKLHLSTHKDHGVFVIPEAERPKVLRLCEKYGVVVEASAPRPDVSDPPGDLGDVGDVPADHNAAPRAAG